VGGSYVAGGGSYVAGGGSYVAGGSIADGGSISDPPCVVRGIVAWRGFTKAADATKRVWIMRELKRIIL